MCVPRHSRLSETENVLFSSLRAALWDLPEGSSASIPPNWSSGPQAGKPPGSCSLQTGTCPPTELSPPVPSRVLSAPPGAGHLIQGFSGWASVSGGEAWRGVGEPRQLRGAHTCLATRFLDPSHLSCPCPVTTMRISRCVIVS